MFVFNQILVFDNAWTEFFMKNKTQNGLTAPHLSENFFDHWHSSNNLYWTSAGESCELRGNWEVLLVREVDEQLCCKIYTGDSSGWDQYTKCNATTQFSKEF